MELRHLRYFVAVAEELNFTHAASKLRVAQPALSRQIHDLEEELQTSLFERRRTGVLLTRAGRIFLPRARTILNQARDAANEARTAGGVISGRLTLGYPSGIHLNHLAPVLETFRRNHPNVEFDFIHDLPNAQLRALRELKIDIGFITMPARLDGFEHRIVWRVPLKVVLPARHPLARRRSFELADLKNEDFVFCTRESRPEFHDEFHRQCANAGFRPRIVKEVGGYPSNMLGLVSVGAGVSVLPHFEQTERIHGIVWRDLVKPRVSVDFALVWRRQNISRVMEEFIATAEKHYPPQAKAAPEPV